MALGGVLVGGGAEGMFASETAFSRVRVQAVFGDAVRGSTNAPPPDVADALGRLLYAAHLTLLLFWLLDRSPAQRATERLLASLEGALPWASLLVAAGSASEVIRTTDQLLRDALFGTNRAAEALGTASAQTCRSPGLEVGRHLGHHLLEARRDEERRLIRRRIERRLDDASDVERYQPSLPLEAAELPERRKQTGAAHVKTAPLFDDTELERVPVEADEPVDALGWGALAGCPERPAEADEIGVHQGRTVPDHLVHDVGLGRVERSRVVPHVLSREEHPIIEVVHEDLRGYQSRDGSIAKR